MRELAASLDYYVRVLGFTIEWSEPEVMACVKRNRVRLFIVAGDQGNPGAWVYVGVDDAAALREEYRASGAKIRHEPTNYKWGYEMQVEDVDGNVLRFGSDPRDDMPLGEWLDMRGGRWIQDGDRNWRKVED